MLLMLLLLVAVLATATALVLLIVGARQRHRRHLSRARREGDYAERRTSWRDHLTRSRTPRRLTDERKSHD